MRLFLYEWVTGGGMLGAEGRPPESLLREGLAMVSAAADDARAAGHTPVVLRDLRAPMLWAAGGEYSEVASRAEHDEAFDTLAAGCDATLLVAPETDGVLLRAARRAERRGARLISPASGFVDVASDKHRTGQALAAAGVPTPRAVVLEPGAMLPNDFPYPAVVKPLDGAGSQDTYVVKAPHDRPPAYAWPLRLEAYAVGVPASVAVLGVAGGGAAVALPACRQRLSIDGRLSYLGGSTPLPQGLARRAERLALDAVSAAGPLVGWAGVDLVLGDDPDGALDQVIEINPRLTTSFVGLRRVVRGGLIDAMIAAAAGRAPEIEVDPRPIAFDADGAVYWD
ncbi:ATP-grasp domain-containing protein [Botrimarina sp.]|uniref:ATP-grasp domain-containing protein n=1 Tax=Botrimarina sp. TaxID=2795802 RepID=UPI0032ED5B9C